MTMFLWVIVPYVCLAVFVVGHVWRYRYDKFGWTTRSSQLYEDRLLRIGSPLFHFGMLGVVGGHVIGLARPAGRGPNAVGLSDARLPRHRGRRRHSRPESRPWSGLAILIYRRRTVGPVFSATTVNGQGDVRLPRRGHRARHVEHRRRSSLLQFGGEYNYREGVVRLVPQHLPAFQPEPELMAAAPLGFQLHALVAFVLFALWPFTRLVHVFSRTDRLPHPALHRLPLPRRAARQPRAAAWLGPLRAPEEVIPWAAHTGCGGSSE